MARAQTIVDYQQDIWKTVFTSCSCMMDTLLSIYCRRSPTLDGLTRLLFWLFDYSFRLFNYYFWLFDYRVKCSKFLLAVKTWFLLLETVFETPNKGLDITNSQMLISNIWILRTNNGSISIPFFSIIIIIRPRLAFVGSKNVGVMTIHQLSLERVNCLEVMGKPGTFRKKLNNF